MGRPPRAGRPFPSHDKPETWLRRGEVARTLNITRESVRSLEEHGSLRSRVDESGEHRFDPDEVYAYARTHHPRPRQRTDGETQAAAFVLFEQGATRRQVVMKLKIAIDRVDAIWEQYQNNDFEAAMKSRRKAKELARIEAEEKERKRVREGQSKLALALFERTGIKVR